MTHVREELHDLISQRLGAEERQRIEEHLASCDACTAERDRLMAARTLLRKFADAGEVSPELRARVTTALEADRTFHARRSWLAAAVAAVVILAAALAIVFLQLRRLDPPTAAWRDYAAVRDGRTTLSVRTSDVAELERWLDAGLPFQTRVFDFAMMNYKLAGGSIGRIGDRPSALFAYRKKSGELVVCQMYEGRIEELPAALETREHDGIRFFVHEREGGTLVFWQEGSVVCVLVAEIPREEAISLAFAKAMKVALSLPRPFDHIRP